MSDPARTLALLWREHTGDRVPQRGPRQRLSVDRVVGAATALADEEGTAAVTMRRLAQELGASTMSVYTYVPGREELLDLMVDAAYAVMPRQDLAALPWRERVTAVARANRVLYEQHPWAVEASSTRPPLGPGLMAKYEHELGALDGLGLDDVDVDAALTFVLDFVRAWARSATDADAVRRRSAMTDAQWWEANAPLLERVFDADQYPLAVRVGAAAGAAQGAAHDAERAWAFGLQRVLDGLEVLVRARS